MIRASIIGGSGYAGGELLRLLVGHPDVEALQTTSERLAGRFVHSVHPNLRGVTTLKFEKGEDLRECDVLSAGRETSRFGRERESAEAPFDLVRLGHLPVSEHVRQWRSLANPTKMGCGSL